MDVPHFWASYPDPAEVESAKFALQGRIPSEFLPDLLLLHSVPQWVREDLIGAARRISTIPSATRSQWFWQVSTWKGRTTFVSPSASTSASTPFSTFDFSDAQSSLLSTTSAPSSLFSPINRERTSHGYGDVGNQSGRLASNANSHQASPLPYTVPAQSFAFPTPPHFPATAGQAVVNSSPGTVNHESFFGQQSAQRPSTSGLERPLVNSRVPKKAAKKKEPKKWACPTCGKCFTRSNGMREHNDTQCINPKRYKCLSCSFSSLEKEDTINHCKDSEHCNLGHQETAPDARNKYASSLTGKLFDTEAELLDDAVEYCKRSKSIPQGDQIMRLQVLLSESNIPELNRELEKQCQKLTGDPKYWQTLTWDDSDAHPLSNMAEYGVQSDDASEMFDGTDHAISSPRRCLEQHGLGIADMYTYVMEVLRKSHAAALLYPALVQQHESPRSSHLNTEQSAVRSTPGQTPVNQGDPNGVDFQMQSLGQPQSTQFAWLDLENNQPPTQQNYAPSAGVSHRRHNSAEMYDCLDALADYEEFTDESFLGHIDAR